MANNKKVIRDEYIRIKMSKEEKELWIKFAENMEVNPTRLARNILLIEAEAKLKNIFIYKPIINKYKWYLKVTKQFDMLEQMKED